MEHSVVHYTRARDEQKEIIFSIDTHVLLLIMFSTKGDFKKQVWFPILSGVIIGFSFLRVRRAFFSV